MKTMQLFFCATMCFVSGLIHAGEAEEKPATLIKKQKTQQHITIHHRPTREKLMLRNAELEAYCLAITNERDAVMAERDEIAEEYNKLQEKIKQYTALNAQLTETVAAQKKQITKIAEYQRASAKRAQNLQNGAHHMSVFPSPIHTPMLNPK